MPWHTEQTAAAEVAARPPILTGLRRGAMGRCPCCGEGRLFRGYLRVVDDCEACGTPLGHIRADDAPPYFTIFIAGHILLPGVFWIEKAYQPAMWIHMAVWLPLFAIACLLLLRPVKGATLAWMLRIGLTGNENGPAIAPPRRGAGDA
ncbi:DUF983 domain-containing protein [Roseomonas sp. PWR1]|uniref:DUF983 domain-containing protein n=1 Tax=Roseomonas nitratireducens TaxID=2820810 RepID=A0ABS4AU41_9PROT|nr:DUF983 domain-containing protein [Neoroseomonas nitratireducens]MBP0464827.1 DUF983 domain-containing protein [Neoroseomonas nitratireducens]